MVCLTHLSLRERPCVQGDEGTSMYVPVNRVAGSCFNPMHKNMLRKGVAVRARTPEHWYAGACSWVGSLIQKSCSTSMHTHIASAYTLLNVLFVGFLIAGLQSQISTEDLLQPLQTNMFSVSSISLPAGFVIEGPKPHTGIEGHNAGGQTANDVIHGGVDMNYRALDISSVSESHVPHVVSIKNWQQQHHIGFEVLDGNKRLARGLSEDDDNEEDDLLDHGHISKNDVLFQKLNNVQQQHQQLERKSLDNKGLTPRSKHSATEQRRRSKINDRFQMLRQLLPSSDQKRDKASFLLEVIEYIQMLHAKVKMYEAERLSQPLEGGDTFSRDRKSGSKEGLVNISHGSPAKMLHYDVKETTEATGYMAYQLSPLRVAHENTNSISDRGTSSLFANRLLQESVCLPSCEDNLVVSKPTLLSFTAPLSNFTEEPPTPTLFPSGSRLFPGGPTTMLAQILHQEGQVEIKAKDSPFTKDEAVVVQPHFQQTGKSLASKGFSFSHDPKFEQNKSPERSSLLMLCDKGPNLALNDHLRSTSVKDISTMRESQNTKDKASHDLGSEVDKLIHSNLKRPKGDCTEKNLADEKGDSAVLGGVVNISSPYSQGLLDTLTRTLQTSGIDLAQATISVQIDLGKPGGSSGTSHKEIATLNTTILAGQNNSATESMCPAKRPKVESEV